jgi:hypothetical protein
MQAVTNANGTITQAQPNAHMQSAYPFAPPPMTDLPIASVSRDVRFVSTHSEDVMFQVQPDQSATTGFCKEKSCGRCTSVWSRAWWSRDGHRGGHVAVTWWSFVGHLLVTCWSIQNLPPHSLSPHNK